MEVTGLVTTVLGTLIGGGSFWMNVLPFLRTRGRNSILRETLLSDHKEGDSDRRQREHMECR